jgi:hypothetical protein
MTKQELALYIRQIKLHEEQATSTNDRLAYWAAYYNRRNYVPTTAARFEHG